MSFFFQKKKGIEKHFQKKGLVHNSLKRNSVESLPFQGPPEKKTKNKTSGMPVEF